MFELGVVLSFGGVATILIYLLLSLVSLSLYTLADGQSSQHSEVAKRFRSAAAATDKANAYLSIVAVALGGGSILIFGLSFL